MAAAPTTSAGGSGGCAGWSVDDDDDVDGSAGDEAEDADTDAAAEADCDDDDDGPCRSRSPDALSPLRRELSEARMAAADWRGIGMPLVGPPLPPDAACAPV